MPKDPPRVSCSCSDGVTEVVWHVEKRWLSSDNRLITSPSFLIPLGEGQSETSCKLILHAQGASFKKARGHGHFNLKCDSDLLANVNVTFTMGLGPKEQAARGPVLHSFADSATCSLPQEQEEWDLRASLMKQSKTVPLRVQIAPVTC